ncbi:MAG TPA: LytTR family DNA-binding domain-containing protein [Burkholderiaceae bacterium]|jgi:DNA-binding LytR/AlgR family response regulator
MNITALIAEDEPLLAANLQAELVKLWPELHICASVVDGEAAVEQGLAIQPDVLFLDISMPGMTGIEAVQALAEDWPETGKPFPLIVFVTAYDKYALQAFERAAVDYLLKPVQPERLAQTCARLQAALKQRVQMPSVEPALETVMAQLRGLFNTGAHASANAASTAVPLRVIQAGAGNTITMVPVDDVLYFEAADKYVRVVTMGREHLIRISLRELHPQLDQQRFWQIHRGTIVRCDAVDCALRHESGKLTLTLKGHPDKLIVSRLYSHLFKGM